MSVHSYVMVIFLYFKNSVETHSLMCLEGTVQNILAQDRAELALAEAS